MKAQKTLQFLLILTTLLTVMYLSVCKGQSGIIHFDEPVYTVTYEIIPSQKVDTLVNTIVFNLPVTKDYFDSIQPNQEVTSWFKTAENIVLTGRIPYDRWKLIIRTKQIWTKHTQ